ncbi:hypothetical protein C0J52_19318 [Blattella germanica]|nr:hypothetical protein C0J52_19318 [Blattella germanica]
MQSQTEVTPPPCTVTRPGNPSPEDASEIRRRQARPLTGKHVRPGTGAKPSTLLTLRRKIQSRQPQLDQEPQLPKK